MIVGKNGSGKSTLLGLLGDINQNRHQPDNSFFYNSKEGDTKSSGWFSIYKTNNKNVFYIEGYDMEYLKIICSEKTLNSSEYCIIYDKQKNYFYKVDNKLKNIMVPMIITISDKMKNEYTILKDTHNVVERSYKIHTKKSTIFTIPLLTSYYQLYSYLINNKQYINLISRGDFTLQFNICFDFTALTEFQNVLLTIGLNESAFDISGLIQNLMNVNDSNFYSKYSELNLYGLYVIIINYLFRSLPEHGKKIIYENRNQIENIKKCKFTDKFYREMLYKTNKVFKEKYSFLENETGMIKLFRFVYIYIVWIFKKSYFPDYPVNKDEEVDFNELCNNEELGESYCWINYYLSAFLFNFDGKGVAFSSSVDNHYLQIYRYFISINFENINSVQNEKNSNFLISLDNLKIFLESLTLKNVDIFDVSFGNSISEGELQNIKSYTKVFQALNMLEFNGFYTNAIILIDEPDKGFHPEWISDFVSNLVKLTNEQYLGNYQFIISTHSPFMLSDIPKEFVKKIEVDEDGKRLIKKASHSFASNYYDLINDSFFLDSTLGKFASKKINEILTNILNDDRAYSRIKNKLKELHSNIHGYVDIDNLNGNEEIDNWLNSIYKYFDKGKLLEKWIVTKNCYRVSEDSLKDLMEIINHLQISDFEKKSIKEQIDINLANIIIKKFNNNYSYLKSLINVIDEPFIRTSLNSELDRVYDLIQTSNVSPNSIDNEIKRLEKRIEKLKIIQEKQNDKVK